MSWGDRQSIWSMYMWVDPGARARPPSSPSYPSSPQTAADLPSPSPLGPAPGPQEEDTSCESHAGRPTGQRGTGCQGRCKALGQWQQPACGVATLSTALAAASLGSWGEECVTLRGRSGERGGRRLAVLSRQRG